VAKLSLLKRSVIITPQRRNGVAIVTMETHAIDMVTLTIFLLGVKETHHFKHYAYNPPQKSGSTMGMYT
jgi:hypothetical protein